MRTRTEGTRECTMNEGTLAFNDGTLVFTRMKEHYSLGPFATHNVSDVVVQCSSVFRIVFIPTTQFVHKASS